MLRVYLVAASDAEPDAERRRRWGDYWFKSSLAAAIRALGHQVVTDVYEAQMVVHLHGYGVERLPEWTYNAIWIHSHPDTVDTARLGEYDAIYCESEAFTRHLLNQGLSCTWLPGASDFRPMDVAKRYRRVFVGNARGGSRPCIDALDGDYEGLAVWGEGWEALPEGVWRGVEFPHERLNALYAAAEEVLGDAHADIARWGFTNPRDYDVRATRGEEVPSFLSIAQAILAPARPQTGYDLGCGAQVRPGLIGVDLRPARPDILEMDVSQGLPASLPVVDVIVADNLLEHLEDVIPLLNSCHGRLRPGGRLYITVPDASRSLEAAYADPTHRRCFVPASFDYFDADHARWQEYGRLYGILPWRVVRLTRRDDRFLDVCLRVVRAGEG